MARANSKGFYLEKARRAAYGAKSIEEKQKHMAIAWQIRLSGPLQAQRRLAAAQYCYEEGRGLWLPPHDKTAPALGKLADTLRSFSLDRQTPGGRLLLAQYAISDSESDFFLMRVNNIPENEARYIAEMHSPAVGCELTSDNLLMSLGRLQLLEKSDPSAFSVDTNNRGSRGVIAAVPLPWRAVFDNGENPELRPTIPRLIVGKKAVSEWLQGEHDSATEKSFAWRAERALSTN